MNDIINLYISAEVKRKMWSQNLRKKVKSEKIAD